MSYAFNTPIIKPKLYVPDDSETGFMPVSQPALPQETEQTHRKMTWLFHKPQDHAVFPKEAQSTRLDKKMDSKTSRK
jgi:hypothetical protein